jgi:hypothetical protein
MPPSPILVETSLTLSRYWLAVSGVRRACRAGVSVEPIRHFGLVFSSGVLISEYVWDLASFAVIGAGCGALSMLWGSPWDAEGVSKESVFVGDRVGRACDVCPQ